MEDTEKNKKTEKNPKEKKQKHLEPVIIPRSEHPISRKNICTHAVKVLYRLKNAGYTAYLVGGGVRDLLLGREPKDFDISTSAHPEEIKKLFKNCWLIGRRFRLAHIKYGKTIIETSTFRKTPENNDEDDEKLLVRDDNTFGTPEEDALRRDFTINGLFYNIDDFSIIDYVDGLEDLKKKSVRSIGDPEIRFQEDPVRMLRAIRFAARLGFRIEEKTFRAIIKHAPEINKASPARLYEEFLRLFAYASGEKSIKLMQKTKLLEHVLPNLNTYLKSINGAEYKTYFKYLEMLDYDTKPENDSPDPAMIMSAVIYKPLRKELESSDKNTQAIHLIKNASHELWHGLIIPRKLRDFIRQSFISIERLEEKTRRRINKNRFINRSCFKNALKLYYFATEAENIDKEKFEKWYTLYHENLERKAKKKGKPQKGAFEIIAPKGKAPDKTNNTDNNKTENKKEKRAEKPQQQESEETENLFNKPKIRSSARILISSGSKKLVKEQPHWLDEI